jgi:hypothetical protein
MEMFVARILLCWELGTDYQHLLSLHSIASYYLSKDHQVWVAGRDVAKLKRIFSDLAINIVQAPFTDSSAELGLDKQAPRSYADLIRRCGYHHNDSLIGLVSAWSNLFDFIQPDLLLLEHAPTALLASRGYEDKTKSLIRIAIGMPFSQPDDNRPAGIFFPGDLTKQDIVRYEEDVVKVINKVCIELSIPRINNLAHLFADIDQCIFQTYGELDHYGYRSAKQRGISHYVGASFPEYSQQAFFPHFKGPKIFCHVKASMETPVLLKTLQAIECSAIVFAEGLPESILRSHQARHILYVQQPVNMQEILAKATFAILNGGVNPVSLCLRAGIPVALFPLHIEQFLMAKRVEALNAGVQLNLSSVDAALQGLQKVNSRQKKLAAGLFEEKYAQSSAHNDLLLQLALVEQKYLSEQARV